MITVYPHTNTNVFPFDTLCLVAAMSQIVKEPKDLTLADIDVSIAAYRKHYQVPDLSIPYYSMVYSMHRTIYHYLCEFLNPSDLEKVEDITFSYLIFDNRTNKAQSGILLLYKKKGLFYTYSFQVNYSQTSALRIIYKGLQTKPVALKWNLKEMPQELKRVLRLFATIGSTPPGKIQDIYDRYITALDPAVAEHEEFKKICGKEKFSFKDVDQFIADLKGYLSQRRSYLFV